MRNSCSVLSPDASMGPRRIFFIIYTAADRNTLCRSNRCFHIDITRFYPSYNFQSFNYEFFSDNAVYFSCFKKTGTREHALLFPFYYVALMLEIIVFVFFNRDADFILEKPKAMNRFYSTILLPIAAIRVVRFVRSGRSNLKLMPLAKDVFANLCGC